MRRENDGFFTKARDQGTPSRHPSHDNYGDDWGCTQDEQPQSWVSKGGPRDPRGPLWYSIAQPSTSRADKSLLNAGDVVAAKTLELESTDVHLPVLNKHVQHTWYPYDFCENENSCFSTKKNIGFSPSGKETRTEQSARNSVRIHLKQRCCQDPRPWHRWTFHSIFWSLWVLAISVSYQIILSPVILGQVATE